MRTAAEWPSRMRAYRVRVGRTPTFEVLGPRLS